MYRIFYTIDNEIYLDTAALLTMARNLGVAVDGIDALVSVEGRRDDLLNPNFVHV